jgi:hypothetical protein
MGLAGDGSDARVEYSIVSEFRIQYRGTLFPIRSGDVTLGRSNYASIVVNNPLASREHALVRPVGGRLQLVDLGGKNGTFLNGKRVDGSVWLEAGDEVKIGTEVLEIVRVSIQDPSALRVPTYSGHREGQIEGETTVFFERSLELAETLLESCTAEPQRPSMGRTIHEVLRDFLSQVAPSTLPPGDVARIRRITSALASWRLGAPIDDWVHAVDERLPGSQAAYDARPAGSQ